MHVELLIIGGGPIGLACALAAQKEGINYLVVERGCLVNSLYNYPQNMTFFSTSERLEIGEIPFVSVNPKPTRPEALEYYRRVASAKHVRIHLFEEVKEVKKAENGYTVTTSKRSYDARFVVIATGFYDIPNMLNIPGEDLPKVTHYYKDPHFYATQRVVVVGANNSSVDAALETFRKGADVTMVVRDTKLGKGVKYWVRPDMENRLSEGSIKAYYGSTLTAIRENEVDIQTPEGPITIKNDFVIATTGYRPDFKFLEQTGVELAADEIRCPVYNSDTMETNMPGVFLAGVVCGGMNTHQWFIENSRGHAKKIVQHVKRVMEAAADAE